MSESVMARAKWMLVTLIAIGAVLVLLGVASRAVWTGESSVPTNSFSIGSLDISTTPASSFLTLSNATPGTSNPTSGGAQIEVQNPGTLNFIYAVTVSTTPATALDTELKLTIRGVDVTTPGVPCDNFDGTVLYGPDGDLVPAGGNLIGDPALGADVGDRTLNAGTSEFLCFKVTLPSTAPTTVQALNTTATFTFSGEQIP